KSPRKHATTARGATNTGERRLLFVHNKIRISKFLSDHSSSFCVFTLYMDKYAINLMLTNIDRKKLIFICEIILHDKRNRIPRHQSEPSRIKGTRNQKLTFFINWINSIKHCTSKSRKLAYLHGVPRK